MSNDRDFSNVARGLAAAANTQGDGMDALVNMSAAMFGDDDPDTEFYRWLRDNRQSPGLRAAAEALGLTVEEGPGFIHKLRDAYIAKIQEDY